MEGETMTRVALTPILQALEFDGNVQDVDPGLVRFEGENGTKISKYFRGGDQVLSADIALSPGRNTRCRLFCSFDLIDGNTKDPRLRHLRNMSERHTASDDGTVVAPSTTPPRRMMVIPGAIVLW